MIFHLKNSNKGTSAKCTLVKFLTTLKGPHSLQHIVLNLIEREGLRWYYATRNFVRQIEKRKGKNKDRFSKLRLENLSTVDLPENEVELSAVPSIKK